MIRILEEVAQLCTFATLHDQHNATKAGAEGVGKGSWVILV